MIFDDEIDIKYESDEPDGSGGFETVTHTRYSNITCRFQKRDEISTQRRREIIGDTAEVEYNYIVVMPISYSDYDDQDFVVYDSTNYKITGSVEGRLRIILTLKEK